MERYREIAIAETNRKVADMMVGLDVLRELPTLEGASRIFISDLSGEVYITTVYDLPTYRRNRQLLAAAGWEAMSVLLANDGDRHTRLSKGDDKISYIMDPCTRGSTCKRVKVGERVQTLYEVRCDKEGA